MERASGQLPLIVGGGLLVILLAVVVFVAAGRCGGSTSAGDAIVVGNAPAPPKGFSFASKYYKSKRDVGQRGNFQVPLTDRSATRGLSLFTYDNGAWKSLAPMQITPDGTSAVNTSTLDVPKTFVVMRRTGGDFQVFGTLDRGVQPGADASRLMDASLLQGYAPAADGSLTGGPVSAIPGQQYATIPIVSSQSAADTQTVNALLSDDAKRAAHVDRIAAEAERGGFDGIEIDYPAVDPGLKSNFTSFVQALSQRLHNSKKKLVVRAPLPRHEGNNWNVAAYDWATLAKSADFLVIAVERDQSIYRSRVPEAVKYLAGQVLDSRKLILEITPLSEEKSEQGQIRTLTTQEALSIAGQITVRDPDKVFTNADVTVSADNINREGGSGPQWAPQGVVSFVYRSAEDQRTVWIENVFSVGYKLEIVQLNRLGGVSVDNASGDPAITNIWPAIDQYHTAAAPTLQQPNPQLLRPQWLEDNKPIPDAGNRAVITWHAPASPGRHILTVIVGDGTIRVADSTPVDVKVPPPGATPAAAQPAAGTRVPPSPTRSAVPPTRSPTVRGR